MAIKKEAKNGFSPVASRLLATVDNSERVGYGLEVFRGLVGSERFKRVVLTTLDFEVLQVPFVTKTAVLILQGDKEALIQGNSVIFRPDNDQERRKGGRYAKVYSPGAGIAGFSAYFPENENVVTAGLVNWGVIKRDEAEALKSLFDGGKAFLRLVAMDPSILDEGDLNPFVEATHSDEPGLQPKTFARSIASRFKGNPLYEVSMYDGIIRVERYEKGKLRGTEEWVTIPPVEGEGFLLVGKKAKTRVG